MKAASINEIKNELHNTSNPDLIELCLRLAKFKKENKELLTYLLFESSDEIYLAELKKEIEEGFKEMNLSNAYYAKKTIRKVLKETNKYIRYTGSKTMEVELLIHFCKQLCSISPKIRKTPALSNLLENQLKKVKKTVDSFHEDLQYDYLKELSILRPDEPTIINRLSSFFTKKEGS